ncbi:glycosyltransferase family 4 protein [Citrobacter amalonaticus]|uniref:glycosyltransferase family 4 protein n=1 Tax=Citrobacter amalonaticus TaxID=35703 RepID=UPI00300C4AB2
MPKQKSGVLSYIFSLENYCRLKARLNMFKPDVVHLHNFYHFLSPSVLLAIKHYKATQTCRVIYTAHDFHLLCPNSGFQYFLKGQRINFSVVHNNVRLHYLFDHRSQLHSLLKVLQHVIAYRLLRLHEVLDVIITPGEFMKTVMRRYGMTGRIEVIRNPVALYNSLPVLSRESSVLHLVYAGRLSPEKGLTEFLHKLNKETTQDIVFHIYGDGVLTGMLEKFPCRKGLVIYLHGKVERSKLMSEIAKYDIFVLPSLWYENAPVSLIEAAANGLPVLVPGYGGLLEMARESAHYFTFEYADDDGELQDVLRCAARCRGKNHLIDANQFSDENYRHRIETIYKQ